MKTLSEPAKAAQQIRGILKKEFPATKFSVTTDIYSMGSTVNASWNDGPTTAQVELFIKKYAYGRFDAMTDYSDVEFDNSIPQARFVSTSRRMTPEAKAKLEAMVAEGLADGCPDYGDPVYFLFRTADLTPVKDEPEYGKQYRLTGRSDEKCISNGNTWAESKIS